MPVISTYAALSARGYGIGAGSPIFGGGGWIGYQTTGAILDNFVDSSGNQYYLFNISNTATALVKTNYQGTVTFYKSIPAYLVTIQVDSSSNIYLGGCTTGASGSGNAYIIKLTSGGALTWARTLNALPTGSVINKVDIDASANVYGYVSAVSGSSGGYVTLNSSGTGSTTVTYTQTGTGTNVLKGYRNSSGNIWVLYGPASLAKPGGTGRGITCRNSAGTTVFNYEPNIIYSTTDVQDFVVDSSDNLYIAATGVDTTAKVAYLVIMKLNSSGVVQWSVAKGYGYTGVLAQTIGRVKLAVNNTGSLFVSYAYSFSATNASFVDALNTSSGGQSFSNYIRVNGNFVIVKALNYSSSNQQLVVSTTNDIFDVPSIVKVPAPGVYANGARTYVYYPTSDTGYTSVSVSPLSQTSGSSSAALVATTTTPTITDITSTLSVISIGTGV
jgi:hypothetical protein